MKNKRAPEIRFVGYTGDWEEYKAGEIFHSVSDKNYSDLPVLSATQEKGMVYRDEVGINIKYDKKSTKNYKRVLPGQFVIHLRSFQGGFAFSNIEGITSPAYTVLDFKNKDDYYSLFWKYIFASDTFIKRLETVTYGIRDGRSISFSDFSTLKFRVPYYKEQIRIGDFFERLDETIALYQQELTTLKQTKQGFLKKLFPKEGESVPEIRFPGCTGDWELRKLEDIAEFNPKSILPEQFEYVDLESVVGINLISHCTEQRETAPSRAQRLAKQGDVFYQTVRPYQKNNYLFDLPFDNYVFSTGYAQMRPYIDSYFLLSRLQEEMFVSNVLDRCTGTSYPAINSKDLAQIEISIPTLKEEQKKIGNFFKQLDEAITLHQRELDALEETKKAFLQKMFV